MSTPDGGDPVSRAGEGWDLPPRLCVLPLNEPELGAMGTSLPEQVELYRLLDH